MTCLTAIARRTLACAAVAGALALAAPQSDAHKPITSPFTYNDDVFPVLRDRCGQCHVAGGVAPMSLMTHEETVPWGESIRVELLAGHMPPWSIDAAAGRFRNVHPLSAREMNVLLTWATGGTPYGNPDKAPPRVALRTGWALGPPDAQLPFPREFTLPATAQDETVEIVMPTGVTAGRALRAVDLLPGTAAIVRSATVHVRPAATPPAPGAPLERVVTMWLPGDETIAVDDGAGFDLPAGAELVVRVRYKKTWQYERQEMRDRSTIGLYFAAQSATPIQSVTVASGQAPSGPGASGTRSFTTRLEEDVRALAIYPDNTIGDVSVVVTAVGPTGARSELIAFRPRAGWARRYWFREPVALPRGTTIETTISVDEGSPGLPPNTAAAGATGPDAEFRLTLDVVPAK